MITKFEAEFTGEDGREIDVKYDGDARRMTLKGLTPAQAMQILDVLDGMFPPDEAVQVTATAAPEASTQVKAEAAPAAAESAPVVERAAAPLVFSAAPSEPSAEALPAEPHVQPLTAAGPAPLSIPDEVVKGRLRVAVAWIMSKGVTTREDIIAECERLKPFVPSIQRAPVDKFAERVTTAMLSAGEA